METWSHITFTELFKNDKKQAFSYRLRTTGAPMPSEYTSEDETHQEEVFKGVLETLTIEQIKDKLQESGVKFHHLAGEKKLKELFVENCLK